MTDIIDKAINGIQDEQERVAGGFVDDHSIKLVKREYQVDQYGEKSWRVEVFVDDGGPLATEVEKNLEADEAQEIFEELVEKYSLYLYR